MLVRIAITVTMTVMPFYLQKVTGFASTKEKPTPVQLAMVPLFSYVTGLIFSFFFQQRMTTALKNRVLPMLIALVVIITTSAPLYFLQADNNYRNLVYPLSAF
jgi:Na+/melibiose symporter-like transporter